MSAENTTSKQPLIRYLNRQQMSWQAVDGGRLDLSQFYEGIESSAEEGGRPAIDPQLLISLWGYAYSQEIGSAREVARRCEYVFTGLKTSRHHPHATRKKPICEDDV
jgi:hypothetical protein